MLQNTDTKLREFYKESLLCIYLHLLIFSAVDVSPILRRPVASVIQDNGPVTLSALESHFSRHSIKQRLAPTLP